MQVGARDVGNGDVASFKCVNEESEEKGIRSESWRTGFGLGVFSALGAAIGACAAFEYSIPFFFDDTERAEGLLFESV